MAFPYLSSHEEASQIPTSLIEELRNKFKTEVTKNPDQFHQQDVNRIESTDWPLQRFLQMHTNNIDGALESLKKAMIWRQNFGVLELSENDFPIEFYKSACIFLYGKDLNNNPVMIIRAKTFKKIKSWIPTSEKYMVYLFEKVDSNNKGLTVIVDCRDAGIKNANLDFLKFLFIVLNDYYPGLMGAALVYKLPAVLEAAFKLVRNWLKDEHKKYIYLVKKKNINEYIAIEQLPDFLLGTSTQSYRTVPNDAPTAEELAKKLGLKEGKAEKLVKHLEQFFTE